MIYGIKDSTHYIVFRDFCPKGLPLSWRLAFMFFIGKHKRYGHVDILRKISDTQTMQVVSCPWQLSVSILEVPIEDILDKYKTHDITACIKLDSKTETDSFKIRGLIHCVGVAKAMLGLRGWTKITPKDLYELAIKNGGVVLWDHKINEQNKQLWQQQQYH